MDDDMIESADFGYFELARRLEAYADLRLSPSVAATTRMRTAVMNAAHRRAALIEADATFDAAGATTSARAAKRAKAARNAWRRPVAAVMAGCLTLALLAGTALAAKPGGPLYAARIWTEMANLPTNPADRARAEIGRLRDRLDEAQRASAAGDVFGAQAALAAYSTIVVEAASGSDGDPAASAAIEVGVTRHVMVLTLMVKDRAGPGPGRGRACRSSTQALDDLGGPGGSEGGDDPQAAPGRPPLRHRPTAPTRPAPRSPAAGDGGGRPKTPRPIAEGRRPTRRPDKDRPARAPKRWRPRPGHAGNRP